MIDNDGYRPNVGIVVCNDRGQVLWARRCSRDGWQFPQGGIKRHETVDQALYRELYEEVGLSPEKVEVRARTRDWLFYDLPAHLQRTPSTGFRGQKQIWYLLRLLGAEADVRLDAGGNPEFDDWRWVDYWTPVECIVAFKREVYRRALTELAPYL